MGRLTAALLALVLAQQASAATVTLTGIVGPDGAERSFTADSLNSVGYNGSADVGSLNDPRDPDAFYVEALPIARLIAETTEAGVIERPFFYCEFWVAYDYVWCQVDDRLLTNGLE